MKRIIFDITDIVEYAHCHNNVSGIQRVQARVIGSMAERHKEAEIICAFWDYSKSEYQMTTALDLFPNGEFNSQELLTKLGVIQKKFILSKGEVKKHLEKYKHRRKYRALKKVELYLSAIFFPKNLERLGFATHAKSKQNFRVNHTIRPLTKLAASDALVFLGANWSEFDYLTLARQHKEQGGLVLQMIYDLIPHTNPEYFTSSITEAFNKFLNRTPDYVSEFICISDQTRRDLLDFLSSKNVRQAGVMTLPLAHEFSHHQRNQRQFVPTDKAITKNLGSRPYVLCVGTIEVRKNGVALLKAWQKLIAAGEKNIPQLVFAGKYGWKVDEFTQILDNDKQLSEFVKLILSPSDSDIAYLYEHCLFTAYPSHYEGWGLPVGEAAWLGKYCIASSTSSIPEVCGDLIEYIEPNDHHRLAQRVITLTNEPEFLHKVENAIREATLRSWDDVADNLFNHIQSLNSNQSKHTESRLI